VKGSSRDSNLNTSQHNRGPSVVKPCKMTELPEHHMGFFKYLEGLLTSCSILLYSNYYRWQY